MIDPDRYVQLAEQVGGLRQEVAHQQYRIAQLEEVLGTYANSISWAEAPGNKRCHWLASDDGRTLARKALCITDLSLLDAAKEAARVAGGNPDSVHIVFARPEGP